MRILITGGTGFIGTALVEELRRQGHEPVLLTRRDFSSQEASLPQERLDGVRAVINMAGESIAGSRWSEAYQGRIRVSRIRLTRQLADAVRGAAAAGQHVPEVFISFSAVGVYGTHPTADFTESSPPGATWLAGVARDWEREAERAGAAGSRLVILRLGVVLGPGGFLGRLAVPFRWFVGGPAGDGRQWISWIHRDDVVALIVRALEDPLMEGIYNVTTPQPATMEEMAAAIGKALGRPSWCRVPALPLRLLYGEMADELILQGQRVLPERLAAMQYPFIHPVLLPAVKSSLKKD